METEEIVLIVPASLEAHLYAKKNTLIGEYFFAHFCKRDVFLSLGNAGRYLQLFWKLGKGFFFTVQEHMSYGIVQQHMSSGIAEALLVSLAMGKVSTAVKN